MESWTARPYALSDVDRILGLINQIQPHAPFTRARWDWAYRDGPGGPGQAWITDFGGVIASLTGALPFDWFIEGEVRKAVLWVDTMTHPDFRKQGLHALLTGMALEDFRGSGLPLAYVFPNDNSVHHIQKTGWLRVMEVPLFARAVPTLDTNRRPSVSIKPAARFGTEVDWVSQNMRESVPFVLARTSKYLNWRYFAKPGEAYRCWVAVAGGRPSGFLVCKLFNTLAGERRFHMIDFWARPSDGDTWSALIRHALREAAESQATEISCWMPVAAPGRPVLIEHGFEPRQTNRYLFAQAPESEGVCKRISDPANWYLTMGDSDVY